MRFGRFVALAEVERVMKIQEVIMKAKAGELKWYQAADILGITDRHLRRLRNRFKVDPTGLFRNRQPSPKRLKQEIVDEILRLYQTEYAGYNVTHFHEELLETHHIKVGYTCVKLLLQKHKLVPKHKKRGHYRRRRERRPLTGMLLHMDGSHHRWFEHPAHERQCLIAIIDDADSKCLAAKFFKEEGTVEVLEVLKSVVQEHGTFVSLYTDRASHFAHTPAAGGPFDPSAITQVDRVLNELPIEKPAIEQVATASPGQILQRFERFLLDGEDCLRGRLSILVPQGARSGHGHVAFCPPFGRMPTVDVNTDYDGVEAVVTAAEIVPWGVRVECRLDDPAEEPFEIPVDLLARAPA